MGAAPHHSSIASLHTAHNNEGLMLGGIGRLSPSATAGLEPAGGVLQPLLRLGSLSSRFQPPAAPVRPVPAVMLVPACDAPEIAMSMEGLLVD
jgi:hypothetical protein